MKGISAIFCIVSIMFVANVHAQRSGNPGMGGSAGRDMGTAGSMNDRAMDRMRDRDDMSDEAMDRMRDRDDMSDEAMDRMRDRDDMSDEAMDRMRDRDDMSDEAMDRMRDRDDMSDEAMDRMRDRDDMPDEAMDRMRDRDNPGLNSQQEKNPEQERRELDKGSSQGQSAREENSRKWWQFWR